MPETPMEWILFVGYLALLFGLVVAYTRTDD